MDFKDETLLAEEVHHLKAAWEQEIIRNKKLSSELNDLERNTKRRVYIFELYAVLLLIVTAVVGGYFLFMTTFYQQTTQACYVEQRQLSLPVFVITRVIHWGMDRDVAVSSSLSEAVGQARMQGCQFPNSLLEQTFPLKGKSQ